MAVKWYRLSAARNLGTASMNLGYCYLRGTGLPTDKDEALRLFRLAVEQGEPKAVDELERLGEPVSKEKVTIRNGIRFVDETAPGKHFGLIGIAGVTPPAHVRKTRNPRHEPDARLARVGRRGHEESVEYGGRTK
jgi:hypothetical protein